MKVLLFWTLVVGIGFSSSREEKDHNKDAHKALCDVLKAAVNKWGDGGATLAQPLKNALKLTLFGYGKSEENWDKLKGQVPEEYHKVDRSLLCGQPYFEGIRQSQPRWTGYSALHDLVCLCTLGDKGWPLNESSTGKEKLCGQPQETFGGSNRNGWRGSGTGKEQITATWTKATSECMEGRGKNLKEALKDFMRILVHQPGVGDGNTNKDLLGEGDFNSYPCSGNKKVCVMYYRSADNTNTKYPMPWWTELNAAIETNEAEKQKNKKEEEKRKIEEAQNNQKAQNQQASQPQQTPRVATVKSTIHEKQEDEQDNPENISSPIATIDETSGTLIIPPSSWLLSALLFI
ncbi:Variant surface glycoprotein [Trypanosoma congolense IL3000]|uniref:Variant surface glycoprotein n=1 Tax=Trypanosoma congolense (strain IL3000) TaxID=1068625 RepID=F9WFV5_TRYCI|nr:Variant surface glycoprotein [Trypanosoma congolense IL3000]